MAFIALLATLQAILLLWFVMIIRLAIRVVRGAHAEDDRSDDEDENTVGDDDDDGDIASLFRCKRKYYTLYKWHRILEWHSSAENGGLGW